jgi:hypothetical protein
MRAFPGLVPALIVVASLVLLVGCPPPTSSTPPVQQTLTFTPPISDGTNTWAMSPSASLDKSRAVSVSLTMPPGTSKLYYLLTNTSTAASEASLVGIGADVAQVRSAEGGDKSLAPRQTAPRRLTYPEVWTASDWRSSPAARTLDTRPAVQAVVTPPTVGTQYTFKDHSFDGNYTLLLTPTQLRYQTVTVANRVLNLWVADDCYDGNADGSVDATNPNNGTPWNPPAHLVTPAMLAALATKFLDGTNSGNDIYHWVTNVYGPEWPDGGTIPGPANTFIDGKGNIHIFIKNLNPTGSTNGGVLEGYFDPTNNFLTTARTWATESNQLELFALDADTLAHSATTQAAWQITDESPSEAISTLAHEFQHMIHFYQKQVLLGTGWTDTWINEMASMATEDLVADKLGVPGPRGVAGTDFTTGSAANQTGRFPDFNYWHETIPLTGWGDYPKTAYTVLDSYANAYAFGAWLIRNYGGPTFLHNLVTNGQVDYRAVVAAVNTSPVTVGAPQTFDSLVRDWGLATFLKSSSVRPGLKYHAAAGDGDGNSFTWSYGLTPVTYNLGSIDLAHYRYSWTTPSPGYYDGPYLYNALPPHPAVAAGASLFLFVSNRAAGTAVSTTLTLPPNVALTVVATP